MKRSLWTFLLYVCLVAVLLSPSLSLAIQWKDASVNRGGSLVKRKRDLAMRMGSGGFASKQSSSSSESMKDVAPSPRQAEKIIADYKVPSVADILKFAIPAVGVWLCIPLLSMIDTSMVGLYAGTAELAALNPAIGVINYSSKLMSFLYAGTTSLIAAASEEDRHKKDKTRTINTLAGAMQMSAYVGLFFGLLQFTFAEQFLMKLIGKDVVDPDLLSTAMKYVRIRAFGMPAAAVIGSAQTASLALKDSVTPVCITAIAALTNFAVDAIMVRQQHQWIGGAAGAAWATIIAQYMACIWFVRWTSAKRKDPPTETSSTTRGILAGRFNLGSLCRFPPLSARKGFAPFVIPVVTTQMGRVSSSVAIDHVVSSCFDKISMAANQIVNSVFISLVPLADSLSLTAQAFVPGVVSRKDKAGKVFAVRKMLTNFMKAASVIGLFAASCMAFMMIGVNGFTTDPNVIALCRSLIPLFVVICGQQALFCTMEGIILGQRDLGFLSKSYSFWTVAYPAVVLLVKRAALAGNEAVSVVTVWQTFLGYALIRLSVMTGRLAYLQRKMSKSEQDT